MFNLKNVLQQKLVWPEGRVKLWCLANIVPRSPISCSVWIEQVHCIF